MSLHRVALTALSIVGVFKSVDLLLPLILTVTVVTVALLLTIDLAGVEAPTRREASTLETGSVVP
ncbi:hypothetical protein [Nocardia sp. NPDC004123]